MKPKAVETKKPATLTSLSSNKPTSATPSYLKEYGDTDLNKASDEDLRKAKSKMNESFQQTQLKPGDPGFVYDKRVSFQLLFCPPSFPFSSFPPPSFFCAPP